MKHAEIASELFSKRYFMGIWDFIKDEILGMKWLNRLIGSVLNACGLDTSGKIGGSVQFFIYDVIKIMVLLGVVYSLYPTFRAIFRLRGQRRYSDGFTASVQTALPPCLVRSHRSAPVRRYRYSSASQVLDCRWE